MDQIDYTILSNLPDEYYPLLLSTLNDLFPSREFPEAWHHSLVYLNPKQRQKNSDLSLLHLVVLSSWKAYFPHTWLMDRTLSKPSQFGFRKYRSCQDNLSILKTEIHTRLTRGMANACLFLDTFSLSNAFDDVIPSILISDLEEIGLSLRLCRFIYNLIHAYKFQFIVNGELTDEYVSLVKVFRKALS